MTRKTLSSLVALAWLTSTAAHAEEETDAATACVRTKAWEARQQGWNLRALDAAALHQGQLYAWPLALAPGVTYRVLSCGEEGVKELDVLLVDGNGSVLARAEQGGREPSLDHTPEGPQRVHLVVRPRETGTAAALHTAIAVLYK